MNEWETLFEGELTAVENDSGFFQSAYEPDVNVRPNYATAQYRLTIDGTSIVYPVVNDGISYYVGNRYLQGGDVPDDGFGLCLQTISPTNYSVAYLRDTAPHIVKVERSIPVTAPEPLDPASMTMGRIVGRRIAGQRKQV